MKTIWRADGNASAAEKYVQPTSRGQKEVVVMRYVITVNKSMKMGNVIVGRKMNREGWKTASRSRG